MDQNKSESFGNNNNKNWLSLQLYGVIIMGTKQIKIMREIGKMKLDIVVLSETKNVGLSLIHI